MERSFSNILKFYRSIVYHDQLQNEWFSFAAKKTFSTDFAISEELESEFNEHSIDLLRDEYQKALEKAYDFLMDKDIEETPSHLAKFNLEADQLLNALNVYPQELDILGTSLTINFLILLIKHDLNDLKDKINNLISPFTNTNTINNNKRIEWLGTQKQLGELFIELKKNGFIADWNYATIKSCFTNSNTIHQILKPDDKDFHAYHQIYSAQYEPKFDGIKPNKTKNQ